MTVWNSRISRHAGCRCIRGGRNFEFIWSSHWLHPLRIFSRTGRESEGVRRSGRRTRALEEWGSHTLRLSGKLWRGSYYLIKCRYYSERKLVVLVKVWMVTRFLQQQRATRPQVYRNRLAYFRSGWSDWQGNGRQCWSPGTGCLVCIFWPCEAPGWVERWTFFSLLGWFV